MDTKRIEALLDAQQERFNLMAEVKGAATDNYASTNKKIKSLLGEGWVSVGERLPEVGRPVLLHYLKQYASFPDEEGVTRAVVDCYGVWHPVGVDGEYMFTPIHWRPLPSPPQTEEKEV